MVDVSVGKNYIIDRLRIDREITVFLEGLFAMALIKTAVKQNAFAVGFDEMHRAGSRLGSSVESNFHILIIAQDKEERQLIFCEFPGTFPVQQHPQHDPSFHV